MPSATHEGTGCASDHETGYPPPMSTPTPLMSRRVKIHDGIIGGLLAVSTILTVAVDVRFSFLMGLTGLIMVSSAFTGFCPVHYAVRLAMPDPTDA